MGLSGGPKLFLVMRLPGLAACVAPPPLPPPGGQKERVRTEWRSESGLLQLPMFFSQDLEPPKRCTFKDKLYVRGEIGTGGVLVAVGAS